MTPQQQADAAWNRGRDAAAAGDLPEALRWLERARRLVPRDELVALTLAGVLIALERFGAARALLRPLRGREAWSGLAACALRLGETAEAVAAVASALGEHAPDAALASLASAVARVAGLPGWVGLDSAGAVTAPVGASLWLDGAALEAGALPSGWRTARALRAEFGGRALLGSGLRPERIGRTEGFVEAAAGGLRGWAWHPAEPGAAAALRVRGASGTLALRAEGPAPAATARAGAFASPRGFAVAAASLSGLGEAPVRVLDAAGRDLLGSPLDPGAERRAALALRRLGRDAAPGTAAEPGTAALPASLAHAPVWADLRGAAPAVGRRAALADVVVPAYRGLRETLDCLDSVLEALPAGARLHVVDDCSPEPELSAALERLAARGRIRLIRNRRNLGFPGSANAGLRACAGRDAVLLNSDTLVAPGWLEGLRAAAHSAPDVGSATALSNDATIFSHPEPDAAAPMPDRAGTAALMRLAAEANGAEAVEVPTGHGFCLYLRRDCLQDVGLLREDVFAQGYGEENDWCLRARQLGWRHVAATGVYVAHAGSTSFGGARAALSARNLRLLNRLHPGYDALIAAHVAADPLRAARRRLDAARWAAARRPGGRSVLLVTHAGGGGVERVVAERCAAIAAEGLRPIVLRPGAAWPAGTDDAQLDEAGPDEAGQGAPTPPPEATDAASDAGGVCVVGGPPPPGRLDGERGGGFPALRYRLPAELPALLRLLEGDRPVGAELHHLLGHDAATLSLCAALRLPVDHYVHDYASFCQRLQLLGPERRYCGEPDVAGCEGCIAEQGSNLEERITVPALLERSAHALGAARRVVAPSADAASRLARHFPHVRPLVRPWEDDAALPPWRRPQPGARHVLVLGGIGPEKGFDVLLACVRDAGARGLPLRFTVLGATMDDERLMAAGPAFVSAAFEEAEAQDLIRAQAADLAFLPSIWPETWCFALGHLWRAGLGVAAFDLGAQAERMRATGRGWLLPLGMTAGGVNSALMGVE